MDFINKIIAWIKGLFKKKECPDCKPADPCADGSCIKPDPCVGGVCDPVKKEISVTLLPVNSDPKIPVDAICTYSTAIKANVTATGISCLDCLKYEWDDNGVLIVGQNTNTLQSALYSPVGHRFLVNHLITCKVSGEGAEAISKPVKLT